MKLTLNDSISQDKYKVNLLQHHPIYFTFRIQWYLPPHVILAGKNVLLLGNSLVVQWLGLCALTAGAQVQSLVEELRSHKPHSRAKKKKKKKNVLLKETILAQVKQYPKKLIKQILSKSNNIITSVLRQQIQIQSQSRHSDFKIVILLFTNIVI